MSWSETSRAGRLAFVAAAFLALSGCTAGPLYGDRQADLLEPGKATPASVRGHVTVAPVNSRAEQIVRNRLIFLLNGGGKPLEPLYEVRLTAAGSEGGVSIESNGGVPTASVYTLSTSYQLVRLSDASVIDTGSRTISIPYDIPSAGGRSQRFAAQRGAIDAREQAGEQAAAQVELAVMSAIRRKG
ncbi:hypothetical protein [Consotaella salsifontis]|uniref:LPS-assembly lipoprotein n=1 Tax=Consotaella salsifontis TaxID=1365950 RepID=A0A1T4T5A2_9HYPH|nr:hypothetical protein [Consotaella salsifontis]SKA35489.1 hypothetical protein SAMN05428963_11939 [Consotaella salsifontis]